jgi:hypothetical protein
MKRRRGLRPTIVLLIKRVIVLAVLVVAGHFAYRQLLARRPALPDRGAEWVAQDYLTALQREDYPSAYALATSDAQTRTTPSEMAETCREVYASIDNWTIATPKYPPTHFSAWVPVTLYYRAAWAPDEARQIQGNLDLKLEDGQWRLNAALPFITAIRNQREQQHMGGP